MCVAWYDECRHPLHLVLGIIVPKILVNPLLYFLDDFLLHAAFDTELVRKTCKVRRMCVVQHQVEL